MSWQTLAPILGVQLVGTLGYSIALLFLAFLVIDLGGASWTYGLVGATDSICQLLGAPILGRWSDQVGRRVVLLSSQAGELRAIGTVSARGSAFQVDIKRSFRPALECLGQFAHALVLLWFHELDEPESRSTLVIDSPYRSGPGTLGTFATRAPRRPNPIGVTTIQLIDTKVDAGWIRTPYIDAQRLVAPRRDSGCIAPLIATSSAAVGRSHYAHRTLGRRSEARLEDTIKLVVTRD